MKETFKIMDSREYFLYNDIPGVYPPSADDKSQEQNRCYQCTMEIEAFTMSLFKFFCELNARNCDLKEIYGFLANIDLACQSLINEVYMIQLRNYDKSATWYAWYDEEDNDGSEDGAVSYMPGLSSEKQHGFEIFEDSISQEVSENASVAAHVEEQISRLNLDNDSAESIREGVRNLQRTETNLRRFANIMNLLDI